MDIPKFPQKLIVSVIQSIEGRLSKSFLARAGYADKLSAGLYISPGIHLHDKFVVDQNTILQIKTVGTGGVVCEKSGLINWFCRIGKFFRLS